MYSDEVLTFKPGIDPSKMPESDKFKLSKDDILHLVETQSRIFYEPQETKPKIEYRPGVRKFTEKELERIHASMRKSTTLRANPDQESEFDSFISRNAICRVNKILDDEILTKGRRLPIISMGLEKSISSDVYFKDIKDFAYYINVSVDENHISEEGIDGSITYHYMYPIGYYTDIDGGYGNPHCNYKIFTSNTKVDEKHKVINILNPEEVGIAWADSFTPYDIGFMYDETGDNQVRWTGYERTPVISRTDKDAWTTTTFFSVVFKCGFAIYPNRYEYAYSSPREDVHSYMRVTFIVNPK